MASVREAPNSEALARWIERQRTLLEAERAEEREQSALLLAQTPPRLLERNGLALLGLQSVAVRIGQGAKLLVELERTPALHTDTQFPPNSFRTGDVVVLEEHADAKKGKAQRTERGVVFRLTDTKITIAMEEAKGKDAGDDARTDLDLPPVVRVVKWVNEATYDRLQDTLATLAHAIGLDGGSGSVQSASPVVRTLLGQDMPTWDAHAPEWQPIHPHLNAPQQAALSFAMRAREFALLHGPPGTGKTTAVAELIVQLAHAHPEARILVCSASNLAVDNVMERVLTTPGYADALHACDARVTRIGHPARVLTNLSTSTLDVQAAHSSEGQLVREVAQEVDALMAVLAPRSGAPRAGNKSARTAPRPKGAERRAMWEQVRALRKEYRKRDRAVSVSVLGRARIVMATCHGAGSRLLHATQFDYVVIDEACQALELACWIPILKLKPTGRLVLAGDHLQLPPTVKTKARLPVVHQAGWDLPATLETTLFDRVLGMYGDECKALLSTQYRMNAEIMAYANEALYAHRLHADESCRAVRLYDLDHVAEPETDKDEMLWTAPLVFYDTTGTGMLERFADDAQGSAMQTTSRCNENEALLVERHIALLLEQGVPPSHMAVLSPYASQVALLATQLRHAFGYAFDVGTVDSMQGREADVVLISLVRSNESYDVGFLAEKRRLNVAMTRAKRQLVVVGDAETVAGSAQDRSDARSYLRGWVEHLHTHALVEMNPSL